MRWIVLHHTIPWTALLTLIALLAPRKRTGRPPFPLEAMLRIHFLQQWFDLSDVAMEEALFDVLVYCEFAGLGGMSRLPDRVSILRFRYVLEEHQSPSNSWSLDFMHDQLTYRRPFRCVMLLESSVKNEGITRLEDKDVALNVFAKTHYFD